MAIPQGFGNGVEGDGRAQEPAKQVEEVDLVIIGAGPTGLLSALLARQLGLSVSILDAKQEPLQVGGADAITARTQQYLEVISNASPDADILTPLLRQGVKCNTSTTFADGEFTSRQSKWWNSIPHTFYNSLLMIGQPFIERLFQSHIDTPVHYAEPALSLTHTTTPQSVTVETATRTVTAKFCIASDGARSFVRQQLGIAWEGTKPNMVWAVLDCWIATDFPVTREIVTLQVDGASRMAWIPRERGMQRFYVLLDGEITQDKTEAAVRKHMAPYNVEFTHVEWFSKFEIKERVASTFAHPTPTGPFLLAGDAAHVHSVNGGQGMNTGLSDAFSLIWRLALLLQHPNLPASTASALLHSYDAERRATAHHVIDVAAQLVRATTAEAARYVDLIETNAGFITGMGVQYTGLASPLVRASARAVWTAGHRAPDLWLQPPTRGRDALRLYQTLRYGRYVLVFVGGTRRVRVCAPRVASVLRLRPLRAAGIGARPVHVSAEEKVPAHEDEGEYDEQDNMYECSWVASGDEYAVLVRPDCYVEFVGAADEVLAHFNERLPGVLGGVESSG